MKALIAMIFLIFTSCDNVSRTYHFNDYIKDNIFLICTDVFPAKTEYESTWSDQGDGSIRLLERKRTIHPCFGNEYLSETFYKKCLQGQVFRSSENDCRGIGTAPSWGAIKLQFCSSNDAACETASFNGSSWGNPNPVKSPAEHSCNVDSTSRKLWIMLSSSYIDKEYIQLAPDIPNGINDFFWRGGLGLMEGDTSEREVLRFIEYGSTEYINGKDKFLKNSTQYVLCQTLEHRL